jgi:hypothetical protein
MIGRRARCKIRAVRVAVAPLDAHFVDRIRIASLDVTVAQTRRRMLNPPMTLRS